MSSSVLYDSVSPSDYIVPNGRMVAVWEYIFGLVRVLSWYLLE